MKCDKLESELDEAKKENRSKQDIAQSIMIGFRTLVEKELGTSCANDGELLLNEALIENEELKREISGMKECKICNEIFDNDKHHPVKTNCGHVYYCKKCLSSIADEGTGKCPICRVSFQKKDIVPINLNFV